MTLHKDAIVQLTHDIQLRRGLLIKRGTSGRVLSKVMICLRPITDLRDTKGPPRLVSHCNVMRQQHSR